MISQFFFPILNTRHLHPRAVGETAGPGRDGQPGPRRAPGARLRAEDLVVQLRHRPLGPELQLQHHAAWQIQEVWEVKPVKGELAI